MRHKLKIDVLCNDGSPLGVVSKDIYGENGRIGLGGAELALLTMCEAWHNCGHRVRLYNSPTISNGSSFGQYPIDTFLPQENRDILIIFRSPNHRIGNARGLKVWWSTDQYTVGDFRDFSTKVDRIITISEFHAKHFKSAYGIEKTTSIDLPVRLQDYEQEIEKVKNRMIFCSVPDRGLEILAQAYPRIKSEIPDVSLVITSDYRLWGVPEPRNERFIQRFFGMEGVKFLGAVPRKEMVLEQMRAEIMPYSCTYDELFCYAVAECQVAGAYPITSSTGALETTNMGTQIEGDASNGRWIEAFTNEVIKTLKDPLLWEKQQEVKQFALTRFSIDKILKEWEKVFDG